MKDVVSLTIEGLLHTAE